MAGYENGDRHAAAPEARRDPRPGVGRRADRHRARPSTARRARLLRGGDEAGRDGRGAPGPGPGRTRTARPLPRADGARASRDPGRAERRRDHPPDARRGSGAARLAPGAGGGRRAGEAVSPPPAGAIVVDASVALSVVLDESRSSAVREAIARWQRERVPLLVPMHFWLEIANALG